jgi:hypothetical protein
MPVRCKVMSRISGQVPKSVYVEGVVSSTKNSCGESSCPRLLSGII